MNSPGIVWNFLTQGGSAPLGYSISFNAHAPLKQVKVYNSESQQGVAVILRNENDCWVGKCADPTCQPQVYTFPIKDQIKLPYPLLLHLTLFDPSCYPQVDFEWDHGALIPPSEEDRCVLTPKDGESTPSALDWPSQLSHFIHSLGSICRFAS